MPFRFHHSVKSVFWGGHERETFPVHYRMNTRRALANVFFGVGFTLRTLAGLDDLSVFGRFRYLSYVELAARRVLALAGLPYPEQCFLAVFQRNQSASPYAARSGESVQGEQLASATKD